MKKNPPRIEMEQYWKSIWEKEASHNTSAPWLVALRADHSNIPEQEPLTITVAEIQERVTSMNSWTAPGTHLYDTHLLAKETICTP